MNKYKGFTLIELIVVIAIIGVLCAILIPTMMGWVSVSRIGSNNSNAKEVYNGVLSACVTLESNGGCVKSGILYVNCNSIESIPDFDSGELSDEKCKNLFIELDGKFEDTSQSKWMANFETSNTSIVTGVVYAQKSNRYCGGFPCPCPEDAKYVTTADTDLKSCLAYAGGSALWPSK